MNADDMPLPILASLSLALLIAVVAGLVAVCFTSPGPSLALAFLGGLTCYRYCRGW